MKKCVILLDDEYTALVSLLNDASIDIRQGGEYYRECVFDKIILAQNILKGEGDHEA